MTTPNQNTELEKASITVALEYLERALKDTVTYDGTKKAISMVALWTLRDAAKRSQELEKERDELKVCAEALNRLWEEDEMGWIVDVTNSECVKCGAKGLTALPLIHKDGCVQDYIYKALSLPSVQAALKERPKQ